MDYFSKQQMDSEVWELQMASKFGDEETTEQILRSHPSLVHEINVKGDTPLHIAARSGHLGVAKLLIGCAKEQVVQSGMHPLRMVNKKKLTVLQEAVRNDHYEVVDLLIKEDPGLTCTTVDGVESPLFMAVEERFYKIALRILETFPNCALSGRRSMTIMHAAVIGLQNYSLCPAILNPCLVFFNSRIKGTEFVTTVLKKIGPEILEERDEFEWIPLHYAAYIGNAEVVELFLKTNSSLAYIKNKQGMSALHISAQEGRIGVIEILMQKCPKVCELLDNKDQTALHVAATNGNLDVLRTLLRMTCFQDLINEPDKEGNTFLHEAARHSNLDILMMLENDRRINKTAINNFGETAGDIVRSSEQLCRHKKVFFTTKLKIDLFPTSLERRVSDETRMEHLNREKEHETSEDTEINVFPQDDKAAGRARDTSTTTVYLPKQGVSYESEQVKNAPEVNFLVATIITSVTFTAFVSMPGGYDDKNGMPILREKLSFQLFLITNSLAFGMAVFSMFIHFALPLLPSFDGSYPKWLVAIVTEISILFTLGAFSMMVGAVLIEKEKTTFSYKTTQLPTIISIIIMCSFLIPLSAFIFSMVKRALRKEKK